MALTIDNLEIQIQSDAQKATGGIDSLKQALEKLNSIVGGQSGLTSNLTAVADKLKGIGSSGKNISSLAKGIETLSKVTSSLDSTRLAQFSEQMKGIADGLAQLNSIEKGNLGSVLNQLKKIPDVVKALDPTTIGLFSDAAKRLTEILAPLASQMEKVGRGFAAMPSNMKKAAKGASQVVGTNSKLVASYNGLFATLSKAAARFWTLYYSMRRIVDVFAEAFNTSNEYIESLNLFKVSMGDASEAAMNYAETVSEAMGIDVAQWITNQGTFMRMSTGFGIASDQAEIMSQNLTQLAYDMASFYNTDVETAMQKLQSGMSGQIKGLKAWGYNLSVAALQETALSLGIEQSVRTMTEAQKAQLRYITLIQKSNGVMGDMAKTINTPANSMRILEAQITRLQRAFGNIVSVLITKYIPYIMAFVEIVEEMANALAEAWGFEIPELPENNLEMGADVIEGIGDEADDTADSLNELKKQLMGFDELNILKSGSNNKDTSYDLGFDMPNYDFMSGLEKIDLEPYKKQLREVLELATNIGIVLAAWYIGTSVFSGLRTLNTLLGGTLATATMLKTTLGIGLTVGGLALEGKGIIDTLKEELDGQNFAEIIGGGLLSVGGAALLGSQIANWIATAFSGSAIDLALTQAGINLGVGTVGAAGAALASAVVGIIAGIPMYLVGIYDAIVNGFDWMNSLLIPLGSTMAAAGIGAIIGACGGPIGAGIGALIGLAVGFVTNGILGIIELLKGEADTLTKVLSLMFASSASTLVPIIGPFLALAAWVEIGITLIKEFSDEIAALWQKFTETPFGSWIDENIVQPFSGAFSWIGELFESFGQTASDIFYNVGVIADGCWQILEKGASLAWEGIKEAFAPLAEFFGNIFSEAWAKVVAVFSPLGPIFEEIKDGILSAFKLIVNGLIKGLNQVISIPFEGINNALTNLKNKEIFGMKPFEGLKTINVPEIPLLASGGFPSMGQMFIARESGPELVGRIGNKNAVANNDQIITGIASAVYNAMMAAREDSGNGEGGTARIVVQIGDQAVGEASVRYINGKIVQTGVSPIFA